MPDDTPAAAVAAAASSVAETSAERLHAKGRAALAQGLIRRALKHLCAAADREPDDPAILADLGAAYVAANDPAQARSILRLALAADPFSFTAHVALAEASAALGEDDDAERHHLAALAVALREQTPPEPATAIFATAMAALGDVCFDSGRHDEATRLADAALERRGDCAEALALRARRLRREKRDDEAMAAFAEAIAHKPDLTEARRRLADMLADGHREKDAIEHLLAATRSRPGRPSLELPLARLLRRQNRHDEAAESFRRVLDRHPGEADALRGLAAVYRDQRRYDQALPLARTLVAQEPRNAWAQVQLGNIEAARGHPAEAVAAYRAAQGTESDLPGVADALGDQLIKLDRRAEAAAAYGVAAAEHPKDAALLGKIAGLHAGLGNDGEAVVWYRRRLAVADDPAARALLARVLLAAGRWDEALAEFDRLAQAKRADLAQPPWTGKTVKGKAVLVHTDGIEVAEEIRFMGAVGRLLATKAEVILECAPERASLWQAVFPKARVIARPSGAHITGAGRISLPALLHRQLVHGRHPAPAQDAFLSILAAAPEPSAERLAQAFAAPPEVAPTGHRPAVPLGDLRDALHRIPRLASARENLVCKRLTGGFHNEIHRVSGPGGDYVMRLPKFPGVGWFFYGEEGHNMKIAHGLGLAPAVHHFDDADGIFLIDFIEGAVLDYKSFLAPHHLEAAAKAFRALHGGPAFLGRYDIFGLIDKNHRRIGDLATSGFTALPGLAERLAEVRRALEANGVPPAPCHNDPIPSNFIAHQGGILIIDWQCSAMTDPHWELGALCAQLNMTPESEAILLAAYFGDADGVGAARVRLYKSACWYYWLTLALAKRGEKAPKEDWEDDLNNSSRRLQRFLSLPEFPGLLDRVRRYRHRPLWNVPTD